MTTIGHARGSSAVGSASPKVAVVTGCSTGIGFATALRLAREGCRVYATVRSEASGAALQAEAADLPLSLLIVDVDGDESVAAGIGSVIAAEGRIDVLVNNAGVSGGEAVETTPMSAFQSVMNTNTWGVVRGIQAVLPTMREQRGGCIVNVTSLAGRVACAGMGAYAASKFAAEAISEALAVEAAQFGIRVAIIEPGVVATPIFDKAMERPPDFTSPYFDVTFRTSRFMLAGLAAPATPDETADVIWRAITTDSPRLRYTVGRDAATLSVERARLPDEEWVAGLSAPDDAEWRANMLAWSGTDVPPM
jgi:NAD(P)-dependent dehydrogenase (short-subunit alcohol dehydrogenase family)